MQITLGEIASRFGLELRGDPSARVTGVCTLASGHASGLAFLADARHRAALASTRATAVILEPGLAGDCPVNALLSTRPQLDFARIASLWEGHGAVRPGIHASAVVSPEADIDPTAEIAAGAVIAAGVRVGARSQVGPGCSLGNEVVVGTDCRLAARVVLMDRVRVGDRVRIEAGAVIGGRGFGLVRDGERWVEMPQLGGVSIGDDVEIGANSTVDRGAIEDTVVEEGVKIDSQVHVAHNCRIGAHSVLAGCVGLAGSVRIGRNCMLAGGVGVADHVSLADGVVVTGMSMVTRDIGKAGVYSSGWGAQPAAEWRRQLAGLRHLRGWQLRLRALEKLMQGRRKDT
jgi:UDP-3-O-[3-hydroxymyristoyl] glucosamine N-acyltransferase